MSLVVVRGELADNTASDLPVQEFNTSGPGNHFSYGPVLSGVLSTIVASRAVRNLSDYMAKKEIVLFSNQVVPVVSGETLTSRNARPVTSVQTIQFQTDASTVRDGAHAIVLDITLEGGDTSEPSLNDMKECEPKVETV